MENKNRKKWLFNMGGGGGGEMTLKWVYMSIFRSTVYV